jgi:hypothetical protein
MIFAVAALTSAALIVPTTSVAAQNWTSVTYNHRPMIQGSGRVVRQNRAVGHFDRILVEGAEVVEVRLGTQYSLSIAADDNLLPLLTSEVKGGTLKLGSRGSYRTRGPVRVWITMPNLESLTASGSGSVAINGVNNKRLALGLNGSGDIRAAGRTGQLNLSLNGSGSARLAGLAAGNADVGIYGSGDASVRTIGDLDARVVGSGTLRYVGQPAHVRRQRTGSGRIVAAN